MPQSLPEIRQQCLDRLLLLHKTANSGHIGSSLSCLEILVDLCFGRMQADDVLVMSKGHAASALYTTLSLSGRLPEAKLEDFYRDDTLLAAHPPCSRAIRAIPFGTGSLGHGLGLACGMTFAQRFTGRSFNAYAVLSDGDCNEGSTWEAALFAAHHRLAQLTVILDLNGLQGIGHSKDIQNPRAHRRQMARLRFRRGRGRPRERFRQPRARARRTGRRHRPALRDRAHDQGPRGFLHGRPDGMALPADVRRAIRRGPPGKPPALTAMRKEFSQWIEQLGRRESRLVFLTGDLGFGALENVQAALGPRFVNLGVSEQNMMSVAAGLAQQGLLPLCYSIAPFAVFRPL